MIKITEESSIDERNSQKALDEYNKVLDRFKSTFSNVKIKDKSTKNSLEFEVRKTNPSLYSGPDIDNFRKSLGYRKTTKGDIQDREWENFRKVSDDDTVYYMYINRGLQKFGIYFEAIIDGRMYPLTFDEIKYGDKIKYNSDGKLLSDMSKITSRDE